MTQNNLNEEVVDPFDQIELYANDPRNKGDGDDADSYARYCDFMYEGAPEREVNPPKDELWEPNF